MIWALEKGLKYFGCNDEKLECTQISDGEHSANILHCPQKYEIVIDKILRDWCGRQFVYLVTLVHIGQQ